MDNKSTENRGKITRRKPPEPVISAIPAASKM
jgi:hypothetical protein